MALSQRYCALILLGAAFGWSEAEARDFRVDQIPHGSKFGCTSCHQTASGGGNFTPFGSATVSALGEGLVSQADIDWSRLASLDSDRDGFTNGEELGDPDGFWEIGDPDPPGTFTHPGNDRLHPPSSCGDGRVTPPEECDGENFDRRTCVTLGLDDGVLVCNEDCSLDRSGCGASGMEPAETDMGQPEVDMGFEVDQEGDEGCSSVGGSASWVLLLFFGLLGRRSRYKKRPRS
ncbi:hypothetical protein FRD01_23430 [Microvenator marinus]|uniref:Temptin Cys/Cys disulfide domain-containing protein n=1 Tax=Microvenator marinus TaxID=2600177 RepID=A0A5B8XY49_9DELT|nr:MYXO-CTERM sorting domain-containing protein [Microvenator marinus]QED30131.1 hypothetical protein FRD01_23430 [Microvenator marinus]